MAASIRNAKYDKKRWFKPAKASENTNILETKYSDDASHYMAEIEVMSTRTCSFFDCLVKVIIHSFFTDRTG
jgi:hypothetical protein